MVDFYAQARQKRGELIYLLGQWLAIPSVYDSNTAAPGAPFGQEVKRALQWFEDLGRKDGFSVDNKDGYAVQVEYGQGEEYIGVFGHGDVVPAGDGWATDPFGLEILNNRAYGRGVVDNKGPMVCCYLALKILRELDLPVKNRIRVVVGGNEESGFGCIRHYFSKEPQPKYGFTPDAKFPVIHGEKGGAILTIKGKITEHEVEIHAGSSHNTIPSVITMRMPAKYGFLQDRIHCFFRENNLQGEFNHSKDGMTLTLVGIGGHSSKPEQSINPIIKLIRFLNMNLDEQWVSDLGKWVMEGNEQGAAFSLSASGRCGNLTIVPTMFHLSQGEFSLIFNIRYPESVTVDFMETRIREYALANMPDQYVFKLEALKNPRFVDPERELVKKLHIIYMKHTGDKKSKVRVTSAGTYAGVMENSVAFGAEFGDGSSGNVHGANEYIDVGRLVLAMGIYAEAMFELANM